MKIQNLVAILMAVGSSLVLTACSGSSNGNQTAYVPNTDAYGYGRISTPTGKLVSGPWCSEGPRARVYRFNANGGLFVRPLAEAPVRGPRGGGRGSWGLEGATLVMRLPSGTSAWEFADNGRPKTIFLRGEASERGPVGMKLRRCED